MLLSVNTINIKSTVVFSLFFLLWFVFAGKFVNFPYFSVSPRLATSIQATQDYVFFYPTENPHNAPCLKKKTHMNQRNACSLSLVGLRDVPVTRVLGKSLFAYVRCQAFLNDGRFESVLYVPPPLC